LADNVNFVSELPLLINKVAVLANLKLEQLDNPLQRLVSNRLEDGKVPEELELQ